jgi:hypothetical protein
MQFFNTLRSNGDNGYDYKVRKKLVINTGMHGLGHVISYQSKDPLSLSKFSIKNFVKENLDKVSVVTIKVF